MTKHTLLTLIIAIAGLMYVKADFTDYYSFPQNNVGSPPFFYYPLQSGSRTFQANAWSILSDNSGWTPDDAPGAQNVSATPSQLSIDSGVLLHFPGALTLARLQVGSVAPSAGFWSFDFNLSLSTPVQTGDRGGFYFLNGATFALPEESGSVSNIFLNPGDTFGFGVYGSVNLSSRVVEAQLQITNFSAPVPEPTTIGLFMLGVSALVAFARRSRASNHAMQPTTL